MSQGKIIKINPDKIFIGCNSGALIEVRQEDCNFTPAIGDIVEIFSNEKTTMVSKVGKREEHQGARGNQSYGKENITDVGKDTNSAFISTSIVQTNGRQAIVNKTIYCLLAIFLGGLGAHKFYAGKNGAGILYLLFCWTLIPEMIAIIEFIAAVVKKADTNGNIVV